MATILSQCVPTTEQICGRLKIKKNKRMKVDMGSGSIMYCDSLSVTTDLSEADARKTLRDWLVFHSFIFDDGMGIKGYNHIPASNLSIESEPTYLCDYDDLERRIYFLENPAEDAPKLEYETLFQKYESLNQEDRGAIRGFLVNFGAHSIQNSPLVADIRYWQIMVYYAVIEYIVGRQSLCRFHPPCNEQGCSFRDKDIPPHNQKTYDEHLKQYMLGRISDISIVDQYMNVLRLVYKEIRNDVAHRAVSPTVEHIEQEPWVTISYDFARVSSGYTSDASALDSLTHMLRDITRYLLLNKLFDLQVFPALRPLQSIRIQTGQQ